jgi:hypothetical protein
VKGKFDIVWKISGEQRRHSIAAFSFTHIDFLLTMLSRHECFSYPRLLFQTVQKFAEIFAILAQLAQ